jgi:hypothetical protein
MNELERRIDEALSSSQTRCPSVLIPIIAGYVEARLHEWDSIYGRGTDSKSTIKKFVIRSRRESIESWLIVNSKLPISLGPSRCVIDVQFADKTSTKIPQNVVVGISSCTYGGVFATGIWICRKGGFIDIYSESAFGELQRHVALPARSSHTKQGRRRGTQERIYLTFDKLKGTVSAECIDKTSTSGICDLGPLQLHRISGANPDFSNLYASVAICNANASITIIDEPAKS